MFGKKNNQTEPDFEYFSLYDTKVEAYRPPVLAINQYDMLRQLDNMFKDPEHAKNQIVQNAEDFQLFKVGDFTKKTGTINSYPPVHVANLHEIRAAALN